MSNLLLDDDRAIEPEDVVMQPAPGDEVTQESIFPRPIRRILIALDASSNSHAALEAAANLAAILQSELLGLFVEDINLLRLTELPFVREVRFAEKDVRRPDQDALVRKLRARAALLRHELEEMASERNLTSSFRVIRGSIDRELLAAALEADLVALGRLGHTVIRHSPLGSTARAIVSHATGAVLLVKTDVGPGPVIALFDGSENGRRALLMAAELANHVGDLRVLVWASNEETAYTRRQYAIQLLEKTDIQLQFQHLSGDDPRRVIEWVDRQKGSLLILGGGEMNLPEDIGQVLVDEAQQHILFLK